MKFLDAIRTVRSIGRYRKLKRAEDVVLDLAVSLEDTDWETNIESEVYLWEHCEADGDEARTMAYNLLMYYEGDKSALQDGPHSEILRFGPRVP